tara:strand:- start:5963 stop:7111 length:1149 start_codon:yes stop_codon:yes gene_type:complete
MKKMLVIHTKYRARGGEDIAVQNELEFLKKYYQVEIVYFDNIITNYFKQTVAFLLNKNSESNSKIAKLLKSFEPDYVYIHNTWFKASLGVFKLLESKKYKIILKLHNFRYDCTKFHSSSKHLKGQSFCKACGIQADQVGIYNKYYLNSYLRSFLLNHYGKKYFKIIMNNDLKIFVLTNFHKKYLSNLGIDTKKVEVFPNHLSIPNPNKTEVSQKYLVYAGRISEEKGVEELINTFLKANLKNINLKIIGNGPLLPNLKKSYNHSRIDFLGEIKNDEVLSIIADSVAVITVTKLLEGQPTLLCEASSMGVPSIFPNSGGISEFFPKNYKLSFNPFDYSDLQKKLMSTLEIDRMVKLGNENKNFIKDYLNEKNLIDKFNTFIDE